MQGLASFLAENKIVDLPTYTCLLGRKSALDKSLLGQLSTWTIISLHNCPLENCLLGQLSLWTISPWTIVATSVHLIFHNPNHPNLHLLPTYLSCLTLSKTFSASLEGTSHLLPSNENYQSSTFIFSCVSNSITYSATQGLTDSHLAL